MAIIVRAGFKGERLCLSSTNCTTARSVRPRFHICVDAEMFAESTEWKMLWLECIPPNILSITSTNPERTIFTRFIPAQKPGRDFGVWRHYYELSGC